MKAVLRLHPHQQRWLIYGSLFVAALLVTGSCFNPELSRSGDNAEFIILARALAHGDGLVLNAGVESVPATKYPPLLPVLLAASEWIWPGDIQAMKWLIVLLFAVSIPLVYRLFEGESTPVPAWLIATSCLLSPFLLIKSHEVMSEIPYMACSLAALLVAQKPDRSWRSLLLILAFAGAAYYIRTAGIALLAAIILYEVLNRNTRSALLLAAGLFLLALPWALYVATHGGGAYGSTILLANPYRPEFGNMSFLQGVARIVRNLYDYGLLHIGRVIVPFLIEERESFGPFDWAGQVTVLLFGIVYFWNRLAVRRPSLTALYLFLYMGMLLCWPQAWTSIRFLVPVIPFLFYAVYDGGLRVFDRLRLPDSVRRRLHPVLILIVMGTNVVSVRSMLLVRAEPVASWRDYYEAARWVRENTPADALVACRKPLLMFLESNRRCLRYAFGEPEVVIRDLEARKATHLVVDTFGEFDSNIRFLYPAVQYYHDVFNQVHRLPSASVLEIHESPRVVYETIVEFHQQKNDLEQIAVALQKLYDLYPDEPKTGILLAKTYADQGAETSANVVLSTLVRMTDPILRGENVDSEVLEMADQIFTQLLRLEPDNQDYLNAHAITILQLGKLREGLRILSELSRSYPTNPRYRTNLAGGLVMASRYAEAIRVLTRVIADHPGFATAYSMLAEAHDILGNEGEAEEARRMAQSLDDE